MTKMTDGECLDAQGLTPNAIIEAIPSYAKDLKLNFSSAVRQQIELNEQRLWGN